MPPSPSPVLSRRALLIGNAAYADARLARLAVPGRDVRAFEAVLRDPAVRGFDAVEVLLDADGERIRRAIERLFRNARHDDLLLLYFSGHGLLDQDGALNLALTNTSIDYPLSSTLDTDFIRKAMNRSASRRQVLILDCCHSGAYASGAKADGSQGIGPRSPPRRPSTSRATAASRCSRPPPPSSPGKASGSSVTPTAPSSPITWSKGSRPAPSPRMPPRSASATSTTTPTARCWRSSPNRPRSSGWTGRRPAI